MALIFLDTPQIGLLEGVRRTDPVRYSSFRDTWKSRGCTLVFTTTQASELRRYPNASRREGRYRVLADLAPIRTDLSPPDDGPSGPALLIHREIFRAIFKRGLVSITGRGAEQLVQQWMDVLPGHLSSGEAPLLEFFENEMFENLFERMYEASRFAAAGEKYSGQGRRESGVKRVSDFPNIPIRADEVQVQRERVASMLSSRQYQSGEGTLPPISKEAMSMISNSAQELLDRASEIGPQAWLLERLPVVGLTEAELQKLTSDELVNTYCFQVQVRAFAHDFLNADDSQQEFLARTLGPAECPGSWLEKRLGLCVRRSCPEPRPNHGYDAERLAYLPYVDLLLTDKEMVEFVRQIRNDQSTPEQIRNARPPVAIPYSLDALQEALDSLEPRASAEQWYCKGQPCGRVRSSRGLF